MESITIFFAPLVALVASAIYVSIVTRLERPFQESLRLASVPVMILFACEMAALMVLGVAGCERVFGGGFRLVCGVVFFFGPPAAANLLVLREDGLPWFAAAALCAVLGTGLFLHVLHVGDTLAPPVDETPWAETGAASQ